MSAIFISHSSRDDAAAGELKARLSEQGHRSVFLDFDPEDGIPAGRDWERELYSRLRGCQAVIVLCSEHSMASRWCFAEIAFARSLGKALLPLKIGECAIPAAFTDVQLVDLRADPEAGYRRLWAGLRQAGLDPAAMFDWDGSRPPYPGLMVFQEQDAAIYFGRGAEIQATVEKLNRMQRLGDGQFAMILGASGSGKSSLLRAGVLPRLKRDKDRWLVPGVFRPLAQPFERLATALSAALKSTGGDRPWQEIRDRLAQPAAKDAAVNLVELANDLRAASGHAEATLLLGIDQFEELLAAGEGDIADRFLALLRALAEVRNGGIIVIGTLRSDFLGNLQNHAALRGVPYEPIDLPQLSVEAFAEVIEGPAKLAGLELEPGLAGAIVADAAIDDALPLLAFALRELWEVHGADGRLTIDEYRNGLGGLQGSVAKSADGLYPKAFATPKEERDVRASFLSMVRVDAGGAYVRRPARWGDLSQSAHGLLERFVQGRLLVARGEGTDRILEVAHEALIRRWDKLRGWVEEDREFLRTRERIAVAAERWTQEDREPSLLLPPGRPLAEGQDLLDRRRADLGHDLIDYVEASVAALQARIAAEREAERKRAEVEREAEIQKLELQRVRSEKEAEERRLAIEHEAELQRLQVRRLAEEKQAAQRLTKFTRRFAVGLAALSVCAVLAAAVAGFFWNQALDTAEELKSERNVAEERLKDAQITQSRFLANLSRQYTAKDDPVTGTLLALEALPEQVDKPGARPVVVEAEAALFAAVQENRELHDLFGHEEFVRAAAFSLDGTKVVTASWDGTARLWSVTDGKELVVLRGHKYGVDSAAFSPDGTRVVTASITLFRGEGEPAPARLWDAATGRELAQFSAGVGGVISARFSPDGTKVLTGCFDGMARLWSAVDGAQLAVLRGHKGPVISAFSADGTKVVTASTDGTARLWAAADGKEITVLRGSESEIEPVAFSPDGTKVLVVSGKRNTARLWDVAIGKELAVLHGHEGSITSAEFSADETKVVTTSEDNTARIWEVSSGKELAVLRGHEGNVNSASFSPDGMTVATASDDRTVRLWDAASGKELDVMGGHEEAVQLVAFSPDGTKLVTASNDKTARMWVLADRTKLAVLRGGEKGLNLAEFSRDGKKVVAASLDGTARLWSVADAKELAVLDGNENPLEAATFSPDGKKVLTVHNRGPSDAVRLWDTASGEELREFTPETGWGRVRSGQFSPDGTELLTAFSNGTVQLWDMASGQELRRFSDHFDLSSAEFSPDGFKVVTASKDESVELWDTGTGKKLKKFSFETGWVTSAQLSPDGRKLLTGFNDGLVRLWSVSDGKELAALHGHERAINSAAYSPDGTKVVTTSDDGTARLWSVTDGKELAVLRGPQGEVYSAAFSPDGTKVLTTSDDMTLRLWSVADGKELAVLRGHESTISSAEFSPDGTKVLTTSYDKTARLWNAASGEELKKFDSPTAQFSPDGTKLLSVSDDGTARLWAADGKQLAVLSHEDKVVSAAFSLDGAKVVTASDDRTARLWAAENGKQLAVLSHERKVDTAAFSPDGTKLVTVSNNGKTIRLWDIATGEELKALSVDFGWVTSAQFSLDGTKLVAQQMDEATLWNTATGEKLNTFEGHSVQISLDGTKAVTVSELPSARLWDAVTGEELKKFTPEEGSVESAHFSPDGTKVVTVSGGDMPPRLWSVATGEELAVLGSNHDRIISIAFSSDSTKVVTMFSDKTTLWSLATGKEPAELRGHEREVNSAAFSADGATVVTASGDGTARLWSVATGKELAVLRGHEEAVQSVAFSPDGAKVLTASYDGTARLWWVPRNTQELIDYARSTVPRQLAPEQRQRFFLDPNSAP